VVADEAAATYEDGVLRVEIPIAPDDERRQVPIRGRERSADE
jgi:HSP20 family molecular chaperone IbpA